MNTDENLSLLQLYSLSGVHVNLDSGTPCEHGDTNDGCGCENGGCNDCHPKCRWECDKPVCNQECHPVCKPLICKTRCVDQRCAKVYIVPTTYI